MSEFAVVEQVGWVVIAAVAALTVARRVGLPPILAYMLAGLVLGPGTGVLVVGASIELLSELGVALLLFLVGLELSVGRIREVGRSAVITGMVQMGLTFGLGAGAAAALGFAPLEALFLGLAVTFSSTVVVVKMLDLTGDMAAPHGRLSVGVLLVQDVAVALALTLVAGLASGGGTGWASLGLDLVVALLGTGALVVAAAAGVRWGLPRLLAWLSGVPESLFIVSLTWCFAFILGAEAMHVSIELGAFVAGVALAQVPQCSELRRRVHPLVELFLAIFFVALGAGLDPATAGEQWLPALVLSLLVLLTKPLIVGWTLGRLGHPDRTGFLAGLTLGQISEFAFVLVGAAAAGGLVGQDMLSLVGLVGLATIGTSALIVPRGRRLYGWLRNRGRWGASLLTTFGTRAGEEPVSAGPEGHVLVVGMNALGRALVEAFAERGERVVAMDTDPAKLTELPARTVVGSSNVPSVLEEAGLERARLVVAALQIEDANALLAHRCREAGVPVTVHAFAPTVEEELIELDVDHLMTPRRDGARRMVEMLRRAGMVG